MNFERLESIAKALLPIHLTGKQFHVTFAFQKKSKLLAIGVNNYKKDHPSHRFGKYESCKDDPASYKPVVHSEIATIIKLGRDQCDDITFVNMRISRSGQFMSSKPCPNCQRVLEQLGYRKIWYYNGSEYKTV